MFEIELPFGAKQIIDRLESAGFSAYIVGGCVRDSLLGIPPKDWDICTSANTSEVALCFSDRKVLETGLNYGTIAVVLDDGIYEITTFRSKETGGKRKSSTHSLEAGTLDEDLSCRDFTINAMAYNSYAGLIDPFGGEVDLAKRSISCVENPWMRFREDPIRILRALRFSSAYGFIIDEKTIDAARSLSPMLDHVSVERIQKELCGILDGENVLSVLLLYKDILSVIIPELKPCIGF